MNPHRDANLANWQDRVPAHLSPGGYDIDRLLADPQAQSGVVAHDAPDLGDVSGLLAVHLQCHIGTDTLSLARLGAVVTGVDFSPAALDAARDLFAPARTAVSCSASCTTRPQRWRVRPSISSTPASAR